MLGIGAVDKQDITYFNGEQVGATGTGLEEQYWSKARTYCVPGRLVKAGNNVIAVRAYSFVFDGGLIGPANQMKIIPAAGLAPQDKPLMLQGKWRFKVEHNLGLVAPHSGVLSPLNPNSPYMLFDNMIAPLLPYALRGVIWYQGESNSCHADQYRRLMVDLIRDWRYHWGQGDFPFIQTQIANFQTSPAEDWPALREAQLQSARDTGNGLAVTIDIGESNNIHPANKQEAGRRLSLWALAETYGANVEPSGPLYRGMRVEGNRIRLLFDHTAGGLRARRGALKGFLIAGEDRSFRPAHAIIEDNTVVISHPELEQPIAVRYAWESLPKCNLYNRANLPASPFRTDTWILE